MRIYKRGNVWWAECQRDYRQIRFSTRCVNRKAAEEFVKRIDAARQMPTIEDAIGVLRMLYGRNESVRIVGVDDAWSNYERVAKACDRLGAKRTEKEKRQAVQNFVEWLKARPGRIEYVEQVDGTVASEYAEYLARFDLKAKTRKNRIGYLSAVWNMLEKVSSEIKNPWKNLAPRVTDSVRIEAFSEEQEKKILRAAKKVGKDWYPVCVIARHTGLRYEDIAFLKWKEIDFKNDIIKVRPRKTARYQIDLQLPMIDVVKKAIKSLKKRGDYLFPLHAEIYESRSGSGYEHLRFREVLDAAGIVGNYTFHSWRHTAATQLAEAGISKDVRKMILGHTTDENAERYDHSKHLKEIKNALEKSK